MVHMLVTYIIGSLALIIKPGPDLTCTIATALSDGKAAQGERNRHSIDGQVARGGPQRAWPYYGAL